MDEEMQKAKKHMKNQSINQNNHMLNFWKKECSTNKVGGVKNVGKIGQTFGKKKLIRSSV